MYRYASRRSYWFIRCSFSSDIFTRRAEFNRLFVLEENLLGRDMIEDE